MNTTSTATTAARAAAEWWAQQLAEPRFNAQSPGHLDFNSLAAEGLASLIADGHPVTADQLADFTDLLEQAVTRQMDKHPGGLFGLRVDYGPDTTLRQVADAAGISTSRFPWKTSMWLRNDGALTASCGYGAPEQVVWAPDGWVAPPCGRIRHEERWDDNGDYTVEHFAELCGRPMYHESGCGDYQPDTLTCAKCGTSRADHYNASYDEIGHAFDYGTADGDD